MAAGGASFLGLIPELSGAPESSQMAPWARLKFDCVEGDTDDWNVHPNGDLNLIDSIREGSSINLEKRWNVGKVDDLQSMIPYPFLFMHAELSPALQVAHRRNLREYLLRGGFLYAEDCVIGKNRKPTGSPQDMFFTTMIEELPRIVPEAKLELLPKDHPIFHCLYHLNNGLPHMQGVPHGLHGLTLNDRVLAVLSPSDNHCGWTNGDRWFSQSKRVQSMQMGANIYVFAMTQTGV